MFAARNPIRTAHVDTVDNKERCVAPLQPSIRSASLEPHRRNQEANPQRNQETDPENDQRIAKGRLLPSRDMPGPARQP